MTRPLALLAIAALIASALFTYALVRAGAAPSWRPESEMAAVT